MQGDVGSAPQTFKGTVALDEYGQRRIKSKKDDIEYSVNQLARAVVGLMQYVYTSEKVIRLMQPNNKPKEGSARCVISFWPHMSRQEAAFDISIQYFKCDKILYLRIECIGKASRESNAIVFATISYLFVVFINFILSAPRRLLRSLEELFFNPENALSM